MSQFSYLAAVAALLATSACTHENDRPMTPANGTTLSSDPTSPSIDPSVGDAPTQHSPNSNPDVPNNDSRGTTMPGSQSTHTDDGSQAPHGSTHGPSDGTGTPTDGPNGAPVGGIH